jgi:hypothetical protein
VWLWLHPARLRSRLRPRLRPRLYPTWLWCGSLGLGSLGLYRASRLYSAWLRSSPLRSSPLGLSAFLEERSWWGILFLFLLSQHGSDFFTGPERGRLAFGCGSFSSSTHP